MSICNMHDSLYFLSCIGVPFLLVTAVFYKYCPFKSKYAAAKTTEDPDDPELINIKELLSNTRFIAMVLSASDSQEETVKRNVFPFYDYTKWIDSYSPLEAEKKRTELTLCESYKIIFKEGRVYGFILAMVSSSMGDSLVLLLTTDLRVFEIGSEVGYDSPLNSVRLLKNNMVYCHQISEISRLQNFNYYLVCSGRQNGTFG